MSKPNILLIVTDQHRLSGVGAYGPTPCRTPNLDRLAREGVRFQNVYTTCPVCSPARASIMTGLYPHGHGMVSNIHEIGCAAHELEDRPSLLSRRLEEQEYSLGYTGKWHLGSNHPYHYQIRDITVRPHLPRDVGFEGQNFPGHGGGGQGYPEFQDYLQRNGWTQSVREQNRYHETGIWEGTVESTEAYFLTEHTLSLVERFREREQPYFIWHNFWGPHSPHWVPQEYLDLYRDVEIPPWPNWEWPSREISGPHQMTIWPEPAAREWEYWENSLRFYYAFTTMIDEQIGRILDHLEHSGALEETVVIFASDHGEAMGSHGGLFNKGWTHFEETLRIPLLIRFPEKRDVGRVVEELVSLADLYPTICDLGGASWNQQSTHGCSLLPLLNGAAQSWRDAVVTEFAGVQNSGTTMRTLRWGEWKYGYNCAASDELYNLGADPHEMTNLAADAEYSGVLLDMRRRLLQWMEQTNDGVRNDFARSRLGECAR